MAKSSRGFRPLERQAANLGGAGLRRFAPNQVTGFKSASCAYKRSRDLGVALAMGGRGHSILISIKAPVGAQIRLKLGVWPI